jgi:transcriptional antiterminator NusG
MGSMSWYVVHTYSGYENKAKLALEERVRIHELDDRIAQVLVPTEQVVEVKNGKKRQVTRKFFPGYILVNMLLDNETWHVVRNTPKITGFVGGARNPPPLPEHEVRRLLQTEEVDDEVALKPLLEYEHGERVRVSEGPFARMEGVVDEVNNTRGKLRVIVTIFGRPTSVELDFTQVEKLA